MDTPKLQILPKHIKLISEIDEFKGKWRAPSGLAPDRLALLKHVAPLNPLVPPQESKVDFVVFSDQERTRLHESHSKDVKVNWPDGHYTNGIEKHLEDLKAMFVYSPDTSIKSPSDQVRVRGIYLRNRGYDRTLYQTHADQGREIHSVHGQEVSHQYVHRGALEKWCYDRRMAVLGQCDVLSRLG